MRARHLLALVVAAFFSLAPQAWGADRLSWQPWNADIFARAKAENRFVILDLEAVWCHWCHVMEETTYADPKVIELLSAKYIPVRVDQDANPDLSNRYGDWGWPATIVFSANGAEIVKLRGYIPPERMASILAAIIEDPSPGPSVEKLAEMAPAKSAFLSKEQKAALGKLFDVSFDKENAGWGSLHRYIDADFMDFALMKSEDGDQRRARMARRTLDAAVNLIDPAWGGIYQYSDSLDWKSPHYEKIMWYQAQGLRQYSQAYALWKEPRYRDAASLIYRYLTTALSSPAGAFFTSQDADVDESMHGKEFYALDAAAREKLGRRPRVDTNVYARENGWAISGLVAYANATGDQGAIEKATAAARWVLANRSLDGGGFRHGEKDRGGPFLGDTLAMAQALLDLYAATGDRTWLAAATAAGEFAGKTFRRGEGGFVTSATREASVGVFSKPVKLLDEQVQAARLFNRLNRYTGTPSFKELAEHAMRPAVAAALSSERVVIGALLADAELSKEPTHITIVARKDDPVAAALHAEARAFPAAYKRLDWWDKREGPLPNPDVTYPELETAAAFACTNRICSLPIFEPEALGTTVAQILRSGSATSKQ